MQYYVYVLKSESNGHFYKGMTTDLKSRVQQHNAGKTKSTKGKGPWQVVYYETFETVEAARSREKYFKTAAGRRFLKSKEL